MSVHGLHKPMDSHVGSDDERPAKARRISRACLQCRARKQRCLPSSLTPDLQAPCKRCQKLSITCSFETDKMPALDVTQSPSRLAQLVVELQSRINQHEVRILHLEARPQSDQSALLQETNTKYMKTTPNNTQTPSPSQAEASCSPGSTMDGIDLGAPIATLRSLGALATDNFRYKSGHSAKWSKSPITFDLISQCLLSDRDSQRAIDIFFKHCHPSAPVLEEDIRHFWREPDRYSPTLILAICSVGTRFWNNDSRRDTIDAVHPSFNNLTNLLDKAVSSLLLRPTPSDVTLDSVRVLLLYAQWMPCSREDGNDLGASQAHAPRSRYNEISAWAILGLAVRYATLLGLDRSAIASFRAHVNGPSEHDVNRLRVWYNLLTCSFNLMLTSGLPASIDPELSVQVAQRFSSHDKTQYPGDLRVTGLVELVGIVHRAMRSSRDVSARQLQAHSLQKLNSDMDAWERTWFSLLHNTEFQHNRLPFNSLRWYRLSLNSASLAPLLSATSPLPTELAREALRHPLKISLTAAAQMILSFSRFGSDFVWELDSQTPLSFPDGPFHVDAGSIGQLYYAVDSTWISHTFAVTFLVICYMRGIINENLQICFQKDSPNKIATKVSSSSWSILPRLLLLALEIFDGVCPTATFHFSRDFQGLIRYAVSLVMSLDQQDANGGETVDDLAFQSLLELMNDSGVDWAGSLLGEPGEFTDWNMSEMLDG